MTAVRHLGGIFSADGAAADCADQFIGVDAPLIGTETGTNAAAADAKNSH
jgi:hypothetical protein